MPQVPIIQGPSIKAAPLQGGFLDTPDISSGVRSLAAGLNATSEVAGKIVDRENQDVAWTTEAKLKTDAAAFTSKLQSQMRGAAVGGVADPQTGKTTPSYSQQIGQWWTDAARSYGDGLSTPQRSLIARNLTSAQAAAAHAALQYESAERERSWAESSQAAIDSTVNLALQTGTPAAAAFAADSIRTQVAQIAQHKGIVDAQGNLDQNWIQQQSIKDTTTLHTNMVAQLQRSDPAAARQYFEATKNEISGTRHDEIVRGLDVAQAAVSGQAAAHEAFGAHVPQGADPSMGNVPLDIVAMRADVEKKFGGNPVAQKAASDSLDRLISDWKATEQQYQTNYKAKLEAGVASGKGLAWAQQQPEWSKLDGVTQAQISDHLESKTYARLARANAQDARQDAADARADRAKGRENFETFVDLQMNPDKLAAMTPQEVKNLALTLSQPQVEHLMTQRKQLNTAADLKGAVLDRDTFGQLAEQFGMTSPMDPSLSTSERQKAAYVFANTKINVDYVMTQAQKAKKAPLTLDEKTEIMRLEMARTVKVNPGWFSQGLWLLNLGGKRDEEVPVVQLTREQAADVEVPDADRKQILQAMQRAYAKTKSSEYVPNDANVRRVYLMSKSKAGALVNAEDK